MLPRRSRSEKKDKGLAGKKLHCSVCVSVWDNPSGYRRCVGGQQGGCDPEFCLPGCQQSTSLSPISAATVCPSVSFVPPPPAIHTDQRDPGYIMKSHFLHCRLKGMVHWKIKRPSSSTHHCADGGVGKIKCLHTARAVSSKCPQIPTFIFDSKQG